jgi:hypothetical protein
MKSRATWSLERDRALVEAMRQFGEADGVIEDFLLCLDLSPEDREELRRVARLDSPAATPDPMAAAAIASGDVIAMNPLTSLPQRAKSRD